jgi:hypothetical protein
MTAHLFSVWSWPTGRYSYFLAPATPAIPVAAGSQPKVALGRAPDDVLPMLPAGSRFMGWGDVAVGTLAKLPGGAK